jgi:hypothetical protein
VAKEGQHDEAPDEAPDESVENAADDLPEDASEPTSASEDEAPRASFELGPWIEPSKRWLWTLTALALASRLFWNLVVHPPGQYIFSDMKKYVNRAQDLAVNGFHFGVRELAWQTWGTHYILAIPFKLFGPMNYPAAAAFWAVMGAAAVPVGYLLACRVTARPLHAKVVGIALLLWHPAMSNTGNFLSETPFLFFQLVSTLLLVMVLQRGGVKTAWAAGLASAVAFAVRPQSAMFFLLVLLTWVYHRKRLPHVGWHHLLAIGLPLLLTLGFSFWRFEMHTGYRFGIAENANMNLTAGRCHNIVTQAFPNEARLKWSERRNNTRDGRRVSLPGYRVLARTFPPNHPLALRPAFDSETIRFVGYVGDPVMHREIRKECFRRTGVFEQARYSVVNASLLWFFGHQWPEMEKGRELFFPPIVFFEHLFRIVILIPSLIGVAIAVWWIRRRPAWSFIAWQVVTLIVIAGIFFGTIRLRTPYDPYSIILAVEVWGTVLAFIWAKWGRNFFKRPEGPPAEE